MKSRSGAPHAASTMRAPELVLLALGLALIALLAAHPLSSPDTFWHLELGEIIAQTRAIPQLDMFSAVHPERPWVQFAWLWELVAYCVVSAAGLTGLRVAQALLMVLTFGALYAIARAAVPEDRTSNQRAGQAAFVAACALLLFVDRFSARPDAPNLLLGTLAAPLLLTGYRRAGWREGLALFALALLWANLHAGTSLLLVGSLAVCAAGATLNAALRVGPSTGGVVPSAAGRAWALFAVAVLALIISPGAVRGIAHFAGVYGSIIDAKEPEWSPSWVMLRYGSHPALVLIAVAPFVVGLAYAIEQVGRVRRFGRAGIDLVELGLCAAYLVLAATAVRNVFLCLLPIACIALRAAPRRAFPIAALLLVLVTTDYATRDAYGGFDRLVAAYPGDLAPDTYPEHAAEFLGAARIEGKILNFPRWGDYLIWKLFPACRVLLDTRRNVTPELWRLSSAATDPVQRRRVLDHAFERYGLDLVVYEGPVFAAYQPEGDWRLLYKAGPEEVYVNARSPRVRQTIDRARRYYARMGADAGDDPSSPQWIEVVTRVGGVAWLAESFHAQQRAALVDEAEHGDEDVRARAGRALGLLYFRAGAYAAALPYLQAAVGRDGGDAVVRYHLAFALLLSGQRDAGLALAREFPPALAQRLGPAQRFRLQQLRHP